PALSDDNHTDHDAPSPLITQEVSYVSSLFSEAGYDVVNLDDLPATEGVRRADLYTQGRPTSLVMECKHFVLARDMGAHCESGDLEKVLAKATNALKQLAATRASLLEDGVHDEAICCLIVTHDYLPFINFPTVRARLREMADGKGLDPSILDRTVVLGLDEVECLTASRPDDIDRIIRDLVESVDDRVTVLWNMLGTEFARQNPYLLRVFDARFDAITNAASERASRR
ncbi:MAG: hypothetical protein ABGY41_04025, partial [Candidatus Poribacteria bacterium]